MGTNIDVESEIAQLIPDLLRKLGILPNGYQCEVHLHRGNRKKRRDAQFEGNWDPDVDSIRIAFSPAEKDVESAAGDVASPSIPAKLDPAEDRLSDVLRALDRAEGRPGYEFVSLKWFRDTALASEGLSWAADTSVRHDVLREAIDRRYILTSKVANPRPPNFPVTAIRLNRQMPEVSTALGSRASRPPAFHPVPIRGGPLSETVLRDRR
jgi:hypothetical protein